MRRVAILGAESTGKTALVQRLQQSLEARGEPVVTVEEALRTWADRHRRAPLHAEQAHIMELQREALRAAGRLAEARQARWLISDTAPITVAVYSLQYFHDASLLPQATAEIRDFDDVLLMGLDLPWEPDGWQRDSPAARSRHDSLLRQALQQAGVAYRMVYGLGDLRWQQALAALGMPLPQHVDARQAGTGLWRCERCSDPECEHRLFGRLGLSGGNARAGEPRD